MRITSFSGVQQDAEQTRRQPAFRASQPIADTVTLSSSPATQPQAPQFAGNLRKRMRTLLATAGIATTLGLGVLAPTAASAAPSDRSGDIPAGQCVNSADDIPQVNANATQTVFDVQGQPLLSESARQQVEQMLMNFYNAKQGEMKLVILPCSDTSDLQGLGHEIFNENLQLGSEEFNDGLLPIINADAFRDNRQGKMSIVPGDYYYDEFNANDSLFGQVAQEALVYLAQAEDARAAGNTAEAQRLTDQAVIKSVEIFIEHAQDYRADHPPLTAEEKAAQAAEDAAQRAALFKLLGMLGLGLVGLGAAGTGGVLYARRRRRLNEAVAEVSQPLIQADSAYKVTRGNVYDLETLKRLLSDTSLPQGVAAGTVPAASPQDVLEAIDTILDGLLTEKNQATMYPQVVEAFISEGLIHSMPEVRLDTVNRMISDGLTRDDYEPFMTLLESETSERVIDTLMDPISQLTTVEEAPKFRDLLKNSPQPGIRATAVAVMTKYQTPETLGEFFTALEKEGDGNTVQTLQQAVSNIATEEQSALLEANLDKGKPEQVRAAALMGLTQLGNAKHFDAIYNAFKADNSKHLQSFYQQALQASVTKAQLPTLFDGLKESTAKLQQMSINLLGTLNAPESVQPLFDYLATEDTKFPQEATGVLVNSTNESHAEKLREIIHSSDPKTDDVEVMSAAVQALSRLNHAEDLDDFFAALDKNQAPNVTQLLMQAIEDSPETGTSFTFVKGLLEDDNPQMRAAAIIALDDYGDQALDPLFDALENANGNTPSGEVDLLRKGLMKIGRDEKHLEYMLKKSTSNNEQVRDIGTKCVTGVLDAWQQRYDYDDDQAMQNLENLSKFKNDTIARKASSIVNDFVGDKANELSRLGSNGDFHSSSSFSTARRYQNERYSEVAQAARSAERELDRRKDAWEEAERRRKAEEARRAAQRAAEEAARRARESASSSSSFSSGGFSSGGGHSSGGGTSW